MRSYFFDTSALVKRYRVEQGTDAIDAIFAEKDATFIISRLGMVETVSALALKVRTQELEMADYLTARKKFLGEIAQKNLKVVRLLVCHFRSAELLLSKYSIARRLRTLDALQLSVALDLLSRREVDVFVSADELLCDIARLEGISTENPLGI
jgi:predicted nucleic acid-binding protein